MSDEVERTLCQLPSVFVYKAPTRTSAEGYRASNFPKDHMWAGKLRIVAKGRQASIILIDANTNAVFATCPYGEGAVERTVDSGRYFILRIVNAQGKHAYIGIAFNERNDAFDFNVALQEHDR
jgi:adaptin ear-binding coat-associated protein 1/2